MSHKWWVILTSRSYWLQNVTWLKTQNYMGNGILTYYDEEKGSGWFFFENDHNRIDHNPPGNKKVIFKNDHIWMNSEKM